MAAVSLLPLLFLSLSILVSYASLALFFLLELPTPEMLSRFSNTLPELAFELILEEIGGQPWLHTLHGNIIDLKYNWVDLDQFGLQYQVHI